MELATAMSLRLQAVPDGDRAGIVITWASWHLNAARLGVDLFLTARPDGDDNRTGHTLHTVEFAAQNLVFRGVVTAMDLCASAVYRLTGRPLPPEREFDLRRWFESKRQPPWDDVPGPLADWLRGFRDADDWTEETGLALELRDVFTHRSARRHVTITVGGPSFPDTAVEIDGVRQSSEVVMPNLVEFGLRRYNDFSDGVMASYPDQPRGTP